MIRCHRLIVDNFISYSYGDGVVLPFRKGVKCKNLERMVVKVVHK